MKRISRNILFWQVMFFIAIAMTYSMLVIWYIRPRIVEKKVNIYIIVDPTGKQEPIESRAI